MSDNLIAIGRERSESAFADFFGYYAGRVKSFLLGQGMEEEISEVLVQKVMVAVWKRAESYDPKKAAASIWLFSIVRNSRIEYLTGNSRVEVEFDDKLLDLETKGLNAQEKRVIATRSCFNRAGQMV